MAYQITNFDGLILPTLMQDGDSQDLGTGAALSAWTPLPGGGYYDFYGSEKSPQGIRPISKSCVLWGNDASELQEILDNLRAKIGVKGRVTLTYDTGDTRWQWARLLSVETPRPLRAVSKFLPCRLTFETGAQHWYGTIQGNGWVVGDETWIMGDGTAELGQNELSYPIEAPGTTITLTHNGNIAATNLRIEMAQTGGGPPGASSVELWNRTTGQVLLMAAFGYDDSTQIIDMGSREVYEIAHTQAVAISSIYGKGKYLYVTTSAAHGWFDDFDVYISGTQAYDGAYYAIDVTSTTEFRVEVNPRLLASGDEETSGTVERLNANYGFVVAEDSRDWFRLAPGDNEIDVTVTGDATDTLTLTFRFYDHYA